MNRLPVQRKGDCTPQDNHIWRKGRGSCSPGKADTKAQGLLLTQFRGCNHPIPPPHKRSEIVKSVQKSLLSLHWVLTKKRSVLSQAKGNPFTVLTAAPCHVQLGENEQGEGKQCTEQQGILVKCLGIPNSWSWELSRGENTALVCYCRKGRHKAQTQQDAAPWELPGTCFKGGVGDTISMSPSQDLGLPGGIETACSQSKAKFIKS